MVRLKQPSLESAGPLSASTLPGVERLTALDDLSLRHCELDPCCLLHITTRLTGLHLSHVTLQPIEDSAMGASRLLQLLARLSELRVLELDEVGGSKWPEQLSLHSAITASSNLQKLVVRAGIETEGWKHVFSAGRKLPHLRTLVALDRMVFDIETQCLSALSPETLACLGSCCPVLEQLAFIASHPLAALQSLTAVTKLEVKQAKNAVVGDLTALTQLQDLMLTASLGCAEEMEFTLRHLLPLIALTGLTHLECPADWDLEQEYEHVFGDDAPAGAPPNVWVQLLEHCVQHDALQLAGISPLAQQLQQVLAQLAVAEAAGVVLPAEAAGLREEVQVMLEKLRGKAAALQGPQA